jgi:hypothetical protein
VLIYCVLPQPRPPPCSSQLLDIFVSGFLNFGGSLSLYHFSTLSKNRSH